MIIRLQRANKWTALTTCSFARHFTHHNSFKLLNFDHAKMVAFPTTLLMAAAISAWILCITAAFSTISFVGRAVSSSYHTSLLFQTKMDNKDGASDDSHLTNTTSSKDKAAIIFLHGLGDSPDGWSSLTEALPNMRPSLSNLDITYVFPPGKSALVLFCRMNSCL